MKPRQKEKVNILVAVMLKEAFDKEVVYVHVKIGKYTVLLTPGEFMDIYIPKIENKK